MTKQSILPVILVIMMAFSLASCGASGMVAAEPAGPTEPVTVAVSFQYGSEVLRTDRISIGASPADCPEIPGMRITSWLNPAGESISPTDTPVSADIIYTAEALPVLRRDSSFLFCDENGLLHPGGPLTHAELSAAINALLDPSAPAQNGLLTDADPVTGSELHTVLSLFYTEEELHALPLVCSDDEPVTRRSFSSIIAGLTGRSGTETVCISEDSRAPADLAYDDPDYAVLMSASVPHTLDSTGLLWTDIDIPSTRPEGKFFIDGYLYLCDENGKLVCDASAGVLTFDSSGRYTSGDPELDALVAGVLRGIFDEHPEASGDELLRLAYEYCLDNLRYLGRNNYASEGTNWEPAAAHVMLETGKGDCHNFSAAFWALSRGLGYQTINHVRALDREGGEHSWSEIAFDGVPYIFDPQLEKNFGNNRYMLTYEYGARYGYRNPASN